MDFAASLRLTPALALLEAVLARVLTSLQRAPALLDTYTLGLLAKFLPTDPASRRIEGSPERTPWRLTLASAGGALSPVAMMSPGAESLDRMGILLSWMLKS